MRTTATRNEHDNTPEAVLFMAFELSENTWKLGLALGPYLPVVCIWGRDCVLTY